MEKELLINDLFYEQIDIDADITLNIGGRYSGKTHSVAQKNLLAAVELPGRRLAGFRKTYASIKESLFGDYADIASEGLGLRESVHFTKTVSPLHFTFANGSQVLFRGSDSPERIKGLSRVHAGHLEEGAEFFEEDFDTILMSLRGKGHPIRVDITSNPVPTVPGSLHWLQRRFRIDEAPLNGNFVYDDPALGKVCLCKSNYQANRFVPQRVIDILEGYKETNPALYKMWVLGEFTEVEGVILTRYAFVKDEPDKRLYKGIGLDFGYSADPAAALHVWLDEPGRTIWIRPVMYNTGYTNPDIVTHFKRCDIPFLTKIVADSAEPKSIEEIRRGGYRMVEGAKKSAGYKAEMATVLQGYQINILPSPYTSDIRRELSTWAWQRDKHDNQLPKPTDGNDHLIDALIMFMANYLARPSVRPTKLLDIHM
jgi:phage terminase large subunit